MTSKVRRELSCPQIQDGPKNFWYALTLPNINRFSKLLHCQNQEKICNNTVTEDPIIPQMCRYTTLWNVRCLKTRRRQKFSVPLA